MRPFKDVCHVLGNTQAHVPKKTWPQHLRPRVDDHPRSLAITPLHPWAMSKLIYYRTNTKIRWQILATNYITKFGEFLQLFFHRNSVIICCQILSPKILVIIYYQKLLPPKFYLTNFDDKLFFLLVSQGNFSHFSSWKV